MSIKEAFSRFLRGWWPEKPGKRVGPTELSRKRVAGLLGVSLVITSLVALSMWNPFASSAVPAAASVLTAVGSALTEDTEAPLAGVYIHGDYAYVGGMSVGYGTDDNVGVRIVDLSDPTNPQLVGRIPLRSRGYSDDHTHGDAVATHIVSDLFQGDVAIVINGVPDTFPPEDYPWPYGIWDVTDPSNPVFLSILNLGYDYGHDGGDLGDKPFDSKAAIGNYFYAIYDKSPEDGVTNLHVAVVDISNPRNPMMVGDWPDNKEEWLGGLSLNERGTRAYITGASRLDGYLYVLDIRDPSEPNEIGRYVFPLRSVDSSVARSAPNSDDSLVALADFSWERGRCGILHIIDTSDLTSIHEISTFGIPESDSNTCSGPAGSSSFYIATDVAIKGNLVYSTWLSGGLRVIDISDPSRPVEVGKFAKSPLSDVALKDDLAVVTRVWASGLYIVRPTTMAVEEIEPVLEVEPFPSSIIGTQAYSAGNLLLYLGVAGVAISLLVLRRRRKHNSDLAT